jgi:hypothetical protein
VETAAAAAIKDETSFIRKGVFFIAQKVVTSGGNHAYNELYVMIDKLMFTLGEIMHRMK